MPNRYPSALFAALLLSTAAAAQNVGIGTTAPAGAAALEVRATDKGFLPPRVAAASAIANPVQGLLVFQTNAPAGYYYYTGSAWTQLSTVGGDWATTGNTGTAAGTNFVGTTDAQPLVLKTNGSAAANERLRLLTDGRITVNRASAQTGDLFAVYGSGTAGALNSTANVHDFPINGYSSGSFAGFYGENTGTGQGVVGTNTSTGTGVYGVNSNVNGYGVFGYNQVAGIGVGGLSTGGIGINGATNGALVTGVRGFNQHNTGTGMLALGNNIVAGTVLAQGSGLAANGTSVGAFGLGTNANNGIGLVGTGNNIVTFTNPGLGAGVVGQGQTFGTVGYASASPLVNDRWGGYFDYQVSPNGYAYVGGRSGGTDYAILSGGAKSTMVPDAQGQNRVMYCPEAPEVLFQDFGHAQLQNGRAHVTLDPVLARNVAVSEQHPLRVFLQLEGDCRGVYVTNKSVEGFDVVELAGGRSNVAFSWQLVANRADATDDRGQVSSRFADVRFPLGPQRPATTRQELGRALPPPPAPAPPLKRPK
ncbi:hypothetical protein LJ737_03605 [Hymenobacter sp. 15J16-1T3B]|uniref:hypothetical protein n=1 Tax=Hymenobacter sp. 15J16-1T3B TaxID=2886941 RepID=UPI001D108125|nr:hypothetical protein [Hymenobacter sp. 15J16-1T3B]MCC3156306.1 hypothetical protein [Hymenobacter sp. 15J16-1T3B]